MALCFKIFNDLKITGSFFSLSLSLEIIYVVNLLRCMTKLQVVLQAIIPLIQLVVKLLIVGGYRERTHILFFVFLLLWLNFSCHASYDSVLSMLSNQL